MEIRTIPDTEIDGRFYLNAQAWGHGQRPTDTAPDPHRPEIDYYGVYDEQGLQAKIEVIRFVTHVGGSVEVAMGGVAGVACLPASRGKGYVGAGLKYMLEQMRARGQVISLLYPFAFDFYRRYGWDWTGERREYSVPTAILKADPATEDVRAATLADRDGIVGCYTRFARQYRGMTRRDEKLWNRILQDSKDRFTYTYVYEEGGAILGYLTYRGGSREETELRDFICLTPRAQRGLLGLLRRHEMQIDSFKWTAPADDGLWSQLTHWKVKTEVTPFCQSRVVDVQAALEAWKPTTELRGQVAFEVYDEHAAWNSATWLAECADGQIAVKRTNAAPQVSLDIQALSQGYLGTPTLDDIRRAERLGVHDEAGYAVLRQLLAGPPMAIYDGF